MSTSTTTDTAPAQAQRKRTLEALERRFAVSKATAAQLNHQHKRDDENNNNRRGNTQCAAKSISSRPTAAAASPMRPATSPHVTPSNKDEETGPAYFKLSQHIHDNLIPTIDKFSDKRGSIVNKVVHDLFQHGDSAQKYMQGSKSIKIDNYILLDNFVQGRSSLSKASFIKALKTQSKRSKKHMSIKQHKKLGTFDLPEEI